MNILLLNIPNENELIGNDPIIIKEQQGVFPPLGLMYIASFLRTHTFHDIDLVDCQALNWNYEDLAHYLRTKEYDVIGFTCMTFTLIDTLLTIKTIKENSNAQIIIGGPHPTIYPDETLHLGADKVVMGEGEQIILEAIESDYKIFSSNYLNNLDLLPYPYRNNIEKYYCVLSPEKLTTMITSRGCPYQCVYCFRPAMGKIFRARSPENIVNEMEECVKLGIKEFFIYDDTFTIDKERVYEICREIKRRDLSIIWDVRSRVNTVDYKLLKAMKYAGCERIHFGVESGMQRILNNLQKNITLNECRNAFQWCKELKIKTLGYFMIGNPGEKKEDINETYAFSRQLNPDYAQFTILTPFPATKLYDMWLEKHNKDVWKDYALNPRQDFKPPIWDEHFTREKLQQILKKIYKSYYLNPKFIWRRLKEVRNFRQLGRYTKAALSLIKRK